MVARPLMHSSKRIKDREEALIGSGLDECVRGTFTNEELLVLDAVAMRVGCYSPFVLSDITHREQPWRDARGSLPEADSSSNPIPDEAILAFFDGLRKSYGMERPSDIDRHMREAADKVRR